MKYLVTNWFKNRVKLRQNKKNEAPSPFMCVSYCSPRQDPETGLLYKYRIITASRQVGVVKEGEFELCANFALASDDAKTRPVPEYYGGTDKWAIHGVGRSCDAQVVALEDTTLKNIPGPVPSLREVVPETGPNP